MMRFCAWLLFLWRIVAPSPASAAHEIDDNQPLALPAVGDYELRILTPQVLELTLVSTAASGGSSAGPWDWMGNSGRARLPDPAQFRVRSGGKDVPIGKVGFRRRVLYAPFKHRDLRIGNYLYLQLTQTLAEASEVEVTNPNNRWWPAQIRFVRRNDPLRWSPAIHVNQTGYMARYPKTAMVGYYLGSLGELAVDPTAPQPAADAVKSDTPPGRSAGLKFQLLDFRSGKIAFEGVLRRRPDKGFPFPCYQEVLEADFSALKVPGEYRLYVPGLGASFAFFVADEVAGAFARTYELGIYHQRCGMANALPYTRFVHGPCHTAPAEVPDLSARFRAANESLQKESSNYKDNPRHTAPQLKNVAADLYPFVNRGPVDVRGGHHDAGDYSKYTINSAAFIHHLMFAADAFPGVSSLDNLGVPESGDGKGDVVEEVKYEADFLAKMQDADGGFYFLVYPRDREYESDVSPDRGDPQVVFPKNTAVTAAATAALAQCASSPVFRQLFPEAASQYLAKAKKGWEFLERAINKYGKDGAYQKITHYGDEFMHDDELSWAACELYLATGERRYEQRLLEWLNPADPNTRRWGWWRLYDAYGCAVRSYAFAARTGRVKKEQLDRRLLEQCEEEIAAAGEDQLRRAQDSAYGTSFPVETKRALSAGWYFSSDAAFDLAVACQLDYPSKRDPRPRMIEAIVSNLNYEQGCNPVNVVYLTGLGWKRQREIVHQFAQNDRRILPPSGIPLGNIQAGFGWNNVYQQELDRLSFPSDSANDQPYPFYDRWGDGFNLSQEFVIINQARGLAYTAWLMAQTSLKDQVWKASPAHLAGWPPSGRESLQPVKLSAPGMDLSSARVVWEAEGRDPSYGETLALSQGQSKPRWVEAEAQWPDGRRVFAASDLGQTQGD